MPSLAPADKCPKCNGQLKRQSTLDGLYLCEKCDNDDPMKSADKWISGGLQPPK